MIAVAITRILVGGLTIAGGMYMILSNHGVSGGWAIVAGVLLASISVTRVVHDE